MEMPTLPPEHVATVQKFSDTFAAMLPLEDRPRFRDLLFRIVDNVYARGWAEGGLESLELREKAINNLRKLMAENGLNI